MKYDNPAGRLLEILTAVSKYEKTADARAVWTAVFSLPKNELSPLLTARIAQTMLLPHEALSMLAEEHPELISPPPSWAIQVCNAFQVHNVHGPIESFKNSISSETLANIRTTAVLLDKGSKRKLLANTELDEMKDSIVTVLNEVLAAAELDDDLRVYLARALRKIITNIEEYELTGATPILESIEQTIGHAMVDAKYKAFLSDSALGHRILDALQAASGVVTVAVGIPALAQITQQLLK